MEIIVCIKQVPDTADIRIDPKTNTLIREGVPSIINPFDTYAIEEGVRLREKYEGKVTVISMGPPQVEDALREAISLGLDEGVLLSDKAFAGADTLATSYTLAEGIKKIGKFDLIICGKQAMDGDTAQVGPGIAEKLNIPHVTYVRKIEEVKEGYIQVERLMEEGYEVIKMPLPALITVVKEINEPRMPSLKGKLKAKSAQIITWGAKDLEAEEKRIGLEGSPTQVIKIFTPQPRGGGEMIEGTPSEQAAKLVEKLRETKII
ncbi:electron transfer flavoprotein subunit beta/FixA family protein [bacterium]|nr:electron transfer flavoprotein subunit beta/FixA family protein [bacterium]MCG2676252.1 electron transfer flavoprotein subunit beta/FixA family protein [bacterium]MCG2678033.1 electron transfer flavoprotein subunit beta/FixA family protein [bacterium]